MTSYDATGSREPASTKFPEISDCVLAVCADDDLSALEAHLTGLDPASYGRVFVETDRDLSGLDVPEGVGVTRLNVGEQPGAALARATDAWLAEWLWVESSTPRNIQMWTGESANEALRSYMQTFACQLEKRWPGCCRRSCAADQGE